MPRDIKQKDRANRLKRSEFVKKNKSKKRAPKKAAKKFPTAKGKVEIRLVIIECAVNKKYMTITYQRRNNVIRKYKIAPYSYRYRNSPKLGRSKALYAYDFDDKHIKSFYVKSIKAATRTTSNFTPKWQIEIGENT